MCFCAYPEELAPVFSLALLGIHLAVATGAIISPSRQQPRVPVNSDQCMSTEQSTVRLCGFPVRTRPRQRLTVCGLSSQTRLEISAALQRKFSVF
jgi:hypothetical protein